MSAELPLSTRTLLVLNPFNQDHDDQGVVMGLLHTSGVFLRETHVLASSLNRLHNDLYDYPYVLFK